MSYLTLTEPSNRFNVVSWEHICMYVCACTSNIYYYVRTHSEGISCKLNHEKKGN